MFPEVMMITREMKKMIGQYVLDAKHIDHLEHTIVEFANVASEEWIIIVHGNHKLLLWNNINI